MGDIRKINSEDFYKQKTSDQKIQFLLRYAILAPSTHNIQPWLFKIESNTVKLYYNPDKLLPQADKDGRDLYISLGCFIENLAIASKYFGVFKSVIYQINRKSNLVAIISFKNLDRKIKKDKKYELLLQAILERNNARGLFQSKKISPKIMSKLKLISRSNQPIKVTFVEKKETIKKLASLTADGLKIAYKNPKFRYEMASVFNNNLSQKKEGIPGYSLRMPFLISFIFPTLVKKFDIGSKISKLNYVSAMSSAAICVISSKKDNRNDWLEVGRIAERLMLECRILGLKTSIFVSSIEMGSLYKKVQKLLGINIRPQFLICMGYMKHNQKYTLRHSAEAKILTV